VAQRKSKRSTPKRKGKPVSWAAAFAAGARKQATALRAVERERIRIERSLRARAAWERKRAKAQADFERRSQASKRGRQKRLARELVFDQLQKFSEARTSGASTFEIAARHRDWIDAQRVVKEHLSRAEWRGVLDRIGDELGLDDDFVDALEESPDEG
jgi:hypothetical protein